MIKHIYKIIWSERRINTWILLELILAFCILWFCCGYFYEISKRYQEPIGFDIDHTYRIKIGLEEDELNTISFNTSNFEFATQILERIKAYPCIESLSVSHCSYPYSDSYLGEGYSIDTIEGFIRTKFVSKDFFDVFKIKLNNPIDFSWDNNITNDEAVISSIGNGTFLGKPISRASSIRWLDNESKTGANMKIVSIADKTKACEFSNFESVVYQPLDKRNKLLSDMEICVRVKGENDVDFAEQFMISMDDKLEVGYYYLQDVEPISDAKYQYIKSRGIYTSIKSAFYITLFLIVNIFIGIIGTFWLRIQTRQYEIGLRCAVGATARLIKSLLFLESSIILFIASLVAIVICINISLLNILPEYGFLTIDQYSSNSWNHFMINYLITFFILEIIILLAIWYPAKKASDVQPAEVLHSR